MQFKFRKKKRSCFSSSLYNLEARACARADALPTASRSYKRRRPFVKEKEQKQKSAKKNVHMQMHTDVPTRPFLSDLREKNKMR